jgi:hypothetical protein
LEHGVRSWLWMSLTTLTIVRGTTVPITFVVKQSGVAVSLTGKALVFVAGSGASQIVKKTSVGGSGFTITDATNGVALLELTVAETRAMALGVTPFTIELWNGSTQTLVLEGRFEVRAVVNVDA